MEQSLIVTAASDGIRSLLEKVLVTAKDGAITISNQDGRTLHLTITETRADLRAPSGSGGVILAEDEFANLIEFIEGVAYGTVIVKIHQRKIIGVEKNEKFKL
ncbi:MAG: YezD family protein [Peptococcaceae bacterium]|nr:YezD family protein [Peptococcaceae bacterium]